MEQENKRHCEGFHQKKVHVSAAGKSLVELENGTYAKESEALTAMVREAKQRGISYGKLVSGTTEWERAEIVRDYCQEKQRKGRGK